MLDYNQSKGQSGIEPWPPLTEIGAKIVRGNPQQSGRIDYGSLQTPVIVGVWECTQGAFEVTYPWNEMACILEGEITITDSKGNKMKFKKGDTHFAQKGDRVTWEVHTPKVRKCFFIYTGDQVQAQAAE